MRTCDNCIYRVDNIIKEVSDPHFDILPGYPGGVRVQRDVSIVHQYYCRKHGVACSTLNMCDNFEPIISEHN